MKQGRGIQAFLLTLALVASAVWQTVPFVEIPESRQQQSKGSNSSPDPLSIQTSPIKLYGVYPGMPVADALRTLESRGWRVVKQKVGAVLLEADFIPAGCRMGDSCYLEIDDLSRLSCVSLTGMYCLSIEVEDETIELSSGAAVEKLENKLGRPKIRAASNRATVYEWDNGRIVVGRAEYWGTVVCGQTSLVDEKTGEPLFSPSVARTLNF